MNPYRRLRAFLHPLRVAWRARARLVAHTPQVPRRPCIWIDVGAHLGETTLAAAKRNPHLTVYAFEACPQTAAQLRTVAPTNYHVIEKAVSERDGEATFHINDDHMTHSLLPLRPEGVAALHIGTKPVEVSTITVPTIRLDTFMQAAGIVKVDYLKVDTQGADLSVVRSAGACLTQIKKIRMEVNTGPVPLYEDESKDSEVSDFLTSRGFTLEKTVILDDDLYKDLFFVLSTTQSA